MFWEGTMKHAYNIFAANVFVEMVINDPEYEIYGFVEADRARVLKAFRNQYRYVRGKRNDQLKERDLAILIASRRTAAKNERRNNVCGPYCWRSTSAHHPSHRISRMSSVFSSASLSFSSSTHTSNS